MIKLSVIGNITADAEVYDKRDKPFIKFSVAVNNKDKVTFVDVFTTKLKIGGYLKKGKKVYVSGIMSVNEFKGKFNIQINEQDIELLSPKEETDKPDAVTQDLPF